MSRLCTCVLLTTLISEHLSLFQPNFGWFQRPLLASLTQQKERMQQISMFFSYWRIQSREPWHVLYQTHYKKKLMRNKFSSTLSLTKLPYFFCGLKQQFFLKTRIILMREQRNDFSLTATLSLYSQIQVRKLEIINNTWHLLASRWSFSYQVSNILKKSGY